MNIEHNGWVYFYPKNLTEFTLGEYIEFYDHYGRDMDTWLSEILKMPEGPLRELEVSKYHVDCAYSVFAHFNKMDLQDVKDSLKVNFITGLYEKHFAGIFGREPYKKLSSSVMMGGKAGNWEHWYLPGSEITASSQITFGEFIDSKVIAQNAVDAEQSKWELLQSICAIFLRQGNDEKYNESFVADDSERLKDMSNLPMWIAMNVLDFWEDFNKYCEETFSVFHESREKSGRFTSLHFKQWGWVNFLKSIAKTKVFDIPGANCNSIECARMAKAYEVLIYASEEKEYNDAMIADIRASQGK